MIARTVTIQLKPNTQTEFTHAIESKILPLLRKQPGFKDQFLLTGPQGKNVMGVSMWEKKELMDAYVKLTYPEVMKTLETYFEGVPVVATYEVKHFGTAEIAKVPAR